MSSSVNDHPSWNIDKGWNAVLEQIHGQAANPVRSFRIGRWSGWGAALVAAVALVIGLGRTVVFNTDSRTSSASVYTTPSGQRASITLPDGSQVVLNAGTRLEVPSDFNRNQRRLKLSGEALFSVQHNSTAPFTVVAGDNEVRVLGTRFVVRRFDTDSVTLVAVKEGKVEVSSSVLSANQEILISPAGRQVLQPTSPSRFSFERGVISFDGITLKDAIQDLNRWFDADIQLGDLSLEERRLEGDYGQGTAGSLAEILELTFDIRVVKEGRTLTLYPRG